MIPAFPPALESFLRRGDVGASTSVGIVVLATLLGALLIRLALQAGCGRSPEQRARHRLLDVVAVPSLIVFVAIVLERFRDLS